MSIKLRRTQPLALSQTPQRGFTLLEILVVLFIIGIVCSIGYLRFGDFGASRRTHDSAQQFAQFLHLVQQQAILENHMYSFHVSHNSYTTYLLTENNTWQEVSAIPFLRKHYFPKNISAATRSAMKYNPADTMITISPAGILSPAQIRFQSPHADHATQLLTKNESIVIQTV